MKRIICVLLVTVLIVSMLLSCSIPLRNSGEEKQRIVVQLDQDGPCVALVNDSSTMTMMLSRRLSSQETS